MKEQEPERVTVQVQHGQLSIEDARAAVTKGNVGAVSMFIGTTRSHTEGKGDTVRLEYDCYEEMATAEMRRICHEVMREWSVKRLFIIHRIGPVPVGEASVVIAVSAAHRDAAIESCRYLIDTLKKTVPIWKKEVYADGRTDWVQGAIPGNPDG